MESLNEDRSPLLTKDRGEGGTSVGDVGSRARHSRSAPQAEQVAPLGINTSKPGKLNPSSSNRSLPSSTTLAGTTEHKLVPSPTCGINRREFAFLNRLLIGEAGRTHVIHT